LLGNHKESVLPDIHVSRWRVESCPESIQQKVISAFAYREMRGSISDIELCQMFGEMIWRSGNHYHTHALSFLLDEETRCCKIVSRQLD
jgi:hypothetical protein